MDYIEVPDPERPGEKRKVPIVEDLDDIRQPVVGELAVLRIVHRPESLISAMYEVKRWDGEFWIPYRG